MISSNDSWIVKIRKVSIVEIVCEGCTEEEAEMNPWDHTNGGETEIEQIDWEVQSVEPNE